MALSCGAPGATITALSFASYGAPLGVCLPGGSSTFAVNASCDAAGAGAVLARLCVGRAACSFVPSDALLSGGRDPCHLTPKHVAVTAVCAGRAL